MDERDRTVTVKVRRHAGGGYTLSVRDDEYGYRRFEGLDEFEDVAAIIRERVEAPSGVVLPGVPMS